MASIKLRIYVPNLDNVMLLFDSIRVWRSENGETGDYFLITDTTAQPATLTGTGHGPFSISGKTLELKVDEGDAQTITFSTPDPVSIDLAVDEINDQVIGATASESGGHVVLETISTGTIATLEITGGSALTELGFAVDDFDNGEDAHILLVADQTTYEYDDRSGAVDDWYKTQYFNSVDESVSSLSDARKGDVGTIVPPANMITALIDVVDPEGKPVEDMRIVFYNVYASPMTVGAYSILGRTVETSTDQAGHAEIDLIRGMEVDVTFSGTGITRRITVPDVGDDFDLMDLVSDAPDNFQIQTPTIPAAVRRS